MWVYVCVFIPAILRCAWKCLCVSRGSGSSPRKVLSNVATSLGWKSPDSRSTSAPLLRSSFRACCRTLFPGTRNRPSTCRSEYVRAGGHRHVITSNAIKPVWSIYLCAHSFLDFIVSNQDKQKTFPRTLFQKKKRSKMCWRWIKGLLTD